MNLFSPLYFLELDSRGYGIGGFLRDFYSKVFTRGDRGKRKDPFDHVKRVHGYQPYPIAACTPGQDLGIWNCPGAKLV